MNVLVITGSVVATSGWGRHSRAIVDELAAQGMNVSVCVEETDRQMPFPFSTIHSTSKGFPVFSFFRNVLIVRRAARKADVVHALDGKFAVYGYLAVLGTSKRLFINGIGTYSVAPLYSPFKGWLFKLVYTSAKKIFCISNYTKERLKQAGIPDTLLSVVFYGAPDLHRPTPEEVAMYTKQYGILESAQPIILTVGAIKSRKGQLDTLHAVSKLRETYPDILYVMAGKGNSTKYLHEIHGFIETHALESNVKIIEDADDRALAFFYDWCTVFALNSNTDHGSHHFEGFGAVVIEAAGFGKPAVGSRDSGIEDAIADGETGFLTNQRDADDIADKIMAVLGKYELLAKNASIRYKEFTWHATAAAYIHAYRND